MTNEEVGQRIGLTHSAVSRIRSGQRMPGKDTILRIERAFGWDAGDQLRLQDDPAAYADELECRIEKAAALADHTARTAPADSNTGG